MSSHGADVFFQYMPICIAIHLNPYYNFHHQSVLLKLIIYLNYHHTHDILFQ